MLHRLGLIAACRVCMGCRSPEEAAAYVRKLGTLLRHVKTCDGRTDTGSLRCDVNVSVRRYSPFIMSSAERLNALAADSERKCLVSAWKSRILVVFGLCSEQYSLKLNAR